MNIRNIAAARRAFDLAQLPRFSQRPLHINVTDNREADTPVGMTVVAYPTELADMQPDANQIVFVRGGTQPALPTPIVPVADTPYEALYLKTELPDLSPEAITAITNTETGEASLTIPSDGDNWIEYVAYVALDLHLLRCHVDGVFYAYIFTPGTFDMFGTTFDVVTGWYLFDPEDPTALTAVETPPSVSLSNVRFRSDVVPAPLLAELGDWFSSTPLSVTIAPAFYYGDGLYWVKWEPTAEIATRIIELSAEVLALTSDLAGAIEDIGTNTTAIAALPDYGERVSTLETNLATAEGEIDTLQTDIGTAVSDIGALETAITGLNTAVAGNTADIGALETAQGLLETEVTTLAGTVSGLDSDIDHLDSLANNTLLYVNVLQSYIGGGSVLPATVTKDSPALFFVCANRNTDGTPIAGDGLYMLNYDTTTEAFVYTLIQDYSITST